MKFFKSLAVLLIFTSTVRSQELYVFTEPASNMPAKSIGVRLTNEGMLSPVFVNRTIPELMIGFNKNLMGHVQGFFSDMDGKYRFEGGSLYAKYRFLSLDGVRSHSRASAFARISSSKRPTYTEDINLEGDNSGFQTGLIFTQLAHKLALSGTIGYTKAFQDEEKQMFGAIEPDYMQGHPGMIHEHPAGAEMPEPDHLISYSLSSGYLLFPVVYKNYNQPNLNLYFEILGKTNPSNGKSYLDFAPALQVVINSRTRIDVGYRFEVTGNLEDRYTRNMYLARVEFNFFNVLN